MVLSLNPSSGWNASGNFDLSLVFSLQQTSTYLAGVVSANYSNPGYSDFTALYDRYRIEEVEVAIMYGTNAYPPGTQAVAQLPILNVVFDPSDNSTFSLSSIMQYQNLHTVQLGNLRNSNGYVVKFKPRSLITAGGSAAAATEMNPWLSKDTPTVPHYGLKLFYDNAGSGINSIIGQCNFYVKYHLAMTSSQ
jgi:hypothetical protein